MESGDCGYAPYHPEIILKLIEIFRVYYNFTKKVGQPFPPAMRLGLATGPVDIKNILYGKLVSGIVMIPVPLQPQ